MFYNDEASKDQEKVNNAKKADPISEVGYLWQKSGLLYFKSYTESDRKKRYVGIMRRMMKQMPKQMIQKLNMGKKVPVRFVLGEIAK